jgi:hypothetical protein
MSRSNTESGLPGGSAGGGTRTRFMRGRCEDRTAWAALALPCSCDFHNLSRTARLVRQAPLQLQHMETAGSNAADRPNTRRPAYVPTPTSPAPPRRLTPFLKVGMLLACIQDEADMCGEQDRSINYIRILLPYHFILNFRAQMLHFSIV